MQVQTAISNFDKMPLYHHSKDDIAITTNTPRRISSKSKQIIDSSSKNIAPVSPTTTMAFTPPPSPSSKNTPKRYSNKYCINKEGVNTLKNELIQMFGESLEQCNATELSYKRQKKTYEHCIDELNIKIRKLEERRIQQQQEDENDNNNSNDNLLINYTFSDEELSTTTLLKEEYKKEIEILYIQQITECEQSTHKIVLHYVSELEKERLETKKLSSILLKQEKVISALEKKLKNQQDDEAQIELQNVELEDKKKLLAVLIDEREELFKKLELLPPAISFYNNKQQYKNRSSIDILAKISKFDLFQDPTTKSYNIASPAPPSPPPKNPLPPIPVIQKSTPLPTTTKSNQSLKKKHSSTKSWSCLNSDAIQEYNIPNQQQNSSNKSISKERVDRETPSYNSHTSFSKKLRKITPSCLGLLSFSGGSVTGQARVVANIWG